MQGQKGQEGDLFGIANLLKSNFESLKTQDIINRLTQQEVQQRGVKIIDDQQQADQGELAELLNGHHSTVDIQEEEEILKNLGVTYTHRGETMTSESQFERKLSEYAIQILNEETLKEDIARKKFEENEREIESQVNSARNSYRNYSPHNLQYSYIPTPCNHSQPKRFPQPMTNLKPIQSKNFKFLPAPKNSEPTIISIDSD